MSFTDKAVVVTGAGSGIGAAIAVKFCEEGAQVSLVDRNQDKLRAVLDTCRNTAGKPHVIVADVTKDADAKRIVEETISCFGQLDVLVNNAGIFGKASVLDENLMAEYEEIMAVNTRSVVLMTNLCAKYLVQTEGNIINISSVASTMVSEVSIYSMSKAAVDHFSRCVARELAPKGVRVNTINPGLVKTAIMENMCVDDAQQNAAWDAMKSRSLLDRLADLEEVADLVAFVASEKGRSITGSSILNDNGTSLRN